MEKPRLKIISSGNCMANVCHLFPVVFIKAAFVSWHLGFVHEQVHLVIALVLKRRHFQRSLFLPQGEQTRSKCLSEAERKARERFLSVGVAQPGVYACTSSVHRWKGSVRKHKKIRSASMQEIWSPPSILSNNKKKFFKERTVFTKSV